MINSAIHYIKNITNESEKNMPLATYATHPAASRGRLYPDFSDGFRSPFQRDRDRLVHSSAFRRLDGKTQVFAYHEGKNYRTRLTHSIEVAQITRTLCNCLNLNENLGEAIALAHDLGHPPFGHAGERGLDNAMRKFGGFDHNVNSLKIMTKLEVHYPDFEGLNLSWETLEGTVKHNGPIKRPRNAYLKEFNRRFDLDLKHFSSLESQVASFADDIAYNNHDIDDGFRAGFFTIEQLCELPFIAEIIHDFDRNHPGADGNIRIYAVTRTLIARMINDLLDTTRENLLKANIETSDDIRRNKQFTAGFSAAMTADLALLRKFLKTHFYTTTSIARMDMKSQKIVEQLFELFMTDYKLLPMELRRKLPPSPSDEELAGAVCAYIAGMTDMAAVEEHRKLFDVHTRF